MKTPIGFLFSSLLLLLILNNTLLAQSGSVKKLFEQQEYCQCIAQCEKMLSKETSPEILYYKVAALIHLYKNNDKSCNEANPLKRSITILMWLNKNKKDTAGLKIKELENDIIDTYVSLYVEDIKLKKWKEAINYLDVLLSYKPQCNYILDKAVCEYALSDNNAIGCISKAIHFQSTKSHPDTSGVFNKSFDILTGLENTNQNKVFNQLMDTLLHNYPQNQLLLNKIYRTLIKKWTRYKLDNQLDSLLEYSKYLLKCYPDKKELQIRITNTVVSIADNLSDQFTKSDTSISALLKCAEWLMTAKTYLGTAYSDFKRAHFFSLRPVKMKEFYFTSLFSNQLEFEVKEAGKKKYTLPLSFVRPLLNPVDIGNIPGYIWNDAPKAKKAKSGKDVIKKESLNYFLLDSLTHLYCNKFRHENKLPPIKWNPDYYRGSKHHARVMASQGEIWHGENLDSTYSNLDSIKIYRDRFFGENVQFIQIEMRSEKYTYEKFANNIIENWKNSPPHRRNMLENYSCESVSTVFTNSNIIIAAFNDDNILTKCLPEYKKIFDLFPGFRKNLLEYYDFTNKQTSYSSQNFPYVGH